MSLPLARKYKTTKNVVKDFRANSHCKPTPKELDSVYHTTKNVVTDNRNDFVTKQRNSQISKGEFSTSKNSLRSRDT